MAQQESQTKPEVETEDITPKGGLRGVAPDQPVQAADADAPNVEYRGKATLRRITKEQWLAAGVKDQGTVEWTRANGYSVPKENLTQEALNVLRADGSFSVPQDS